MKWLKENGCSWNFRTFEYAARNGDLDNIKWLKENGALCSMFGFGLPTATAFQVLIYDKIEYMNRYEFLRKSKKFLRKT